MLVRTEPLNGTQARGSSSEKPAQAHGRLRGDATGCVEAIRCPAPSFIFTLTIFDTPGSAIVTPYSTSASCMVRLWCVIRMNCERSVIDANHLVVSSDVGLVERGIDLVEDAERRRSNLENGEDEAHRGERLLAAAHELDAGELLARRLGDDVDSRLEHVLGVGQSQLGATAAEHARKDLSEALLTASNVSSKRRRDSRFICWIARVRSASAFSRSAFWVV